MSSDTRRLLTICGWKIGFEKVQFTKMLQIELGIGLSEAKTITDSVVDKKQIELPIGDRDHGYIAKRATELGALVLTKEGESVCP